MQARCEIYDRDSEGIYHCFSRCVRRAFLCGEDAYSGKNYDHRKGWLEDLLRTAATGFVIDLISFGIMSNHFHVMLRNRPDRRKKMSPTEVARRWLLLYPRRRDDQGKACEPNWAEIKQITSDAERVKTLRQRLGDISWMMGYVKERLARAANREDNVKGTFFEKRFEMRRLLSDNAALACSIYIDLNPIRAGVAKTPEESLHTSAYLRIRALRARSAGDLSGQAAVDNWLAVIPDPTLSPPSQEGSRTEPLISPDAALPVTLEQYLQLLDWSGRQVHPGKSGKIPDNLAPILARLGMESEKWVKLVRQFGNLFRRIAGDASAVEQHAAEKGRRWFQGVHNCREHFRKSQE